MGGHPSRPQPEGGAHQGTRLLPPADPGRVHLRSGPRWENHVHIRNCIGASWALAGNFKSKFPVNTSFTAH